MDAFVQARDHVAPEAGNPAPLVLAPTVNLNDLLAVRLADEPDATLAEVRDAPGGEWRAVSVREFDAAVHAVAKGLVACGIRPGDPVAVMCRTRYEWTVLDFAIWAAGAVSVPIDEHAGAEQVEWALAEAGVRLLVVEDEDAAALVASVRANVPDLDDVLVVDHGALESLTELGGSVDDATIARRRALASGADLATIVYTSPATGRPRGVELTHGNFASLATNTAVALPEVFAPGGRTLLSLPLAHVLARFVEVAAVAGGVVLGHTRDPRTLADDLRTFRPTFLLAVPGVLERLYAAAEASAAQAGHRRRFRWAARVAIAWSRALDTPAGASHRLRLEHRLADRLVLAGLRAALGGRVRYAVTGGSALGERLGHLYRGLGIEVLEGYGLTECTGPTTVNRPARSRIGTVGEPLPGCYVRIADDGEIQLRGHHVLRGYHRDPRTTDEAFDDGWFRTGDVGTLDEDGFLTVTGRLSQTRHGAHDGAAYPDRVRAHRRLSRAGA